MKITKSLLLLILGFGFFIALPFGIAKAVSGSSYGNIINTSTLPKDDAYKAIVKIKSFNLNADNELNLFSTGSGVIINPSGTILTNRHVVISEDNFDNSQNPSTYIICLTTNINKEPDCRYTARLIASNADLDVALLTIDKIPGYDSPGSFPYLNLKLIDNTAVNDEVTALGYPAIGGDTITITKGVISGKDTKYGRDWLKTDAVTSYGSSGGAAIDEQGQVMGITSSAHSDTLGTLGYIINISSLNAWINDNILGLPQASSLEDRAVTLVKRIINLDSSNEFTNNLPAYKITKQNDWKFTLDDETNVFIDKPSDGDGGMVEISSLAFPYSVDTSVVEASIKRNLSFLISEVTIMKNEDTTINGNSAKKVVISAAGQQNNYYYVPEGNYLLKIIYDYGKDDKDKAIIDNAINSLVLTGTGHYSETTKYSNNNPKFNINLSNDWVLLPRNSKIHPVFMMYKPNKQVFADIEVTKTDDNTKNLSNDDYLKIIDQTIKEGNSLSAIYDLKTEITKEDAHYKLSDSLSDVIMIDTSYKSISTGEILVQNRGYYIKSGDKYIAPSMNYFNSDSSGYSQILNKFNIMLASSLSLESSTVFNSPTAPTTPTTPTAPTTPTTPTAPMPVSINNTAVINATNTSAYKSLKGKIILKVQANGEAYYIHPSNSKIYYLGRPEDAFSVMRQQGVGITNTDLAKIPVGFSSLTGVDTDGDGLPDALEEAIGTNPNSVDTDNDGYNDKSELENNFDPAKGAGARLTIDENFANKQKGKILLEVEHKGEAWYVSPVDGKRYFLGRPADAFNVMKSLGLGISNSDFDNLSQ